LFGGKAGAGASNNLIATAAGAIVGLLSGGGGASAGGPPAGLSNPGLLAFHGFAEGGSFNVADGYVRSLPSGIDNRLVTFRANDSEQVTVSKRGAPVGGSKVELHIHGVTNLNEFNASMPQIAGRVARELSRHSRRQN